MTELKISTAVQELLCCPKCRHKLELSMQKLVCQNPQCGASYPVVDGVPVLIDESDSIIKINDILSHRNSAGSSERGWIKRLLPGISLNIKARHNYEKLTALLLAQSDAPRVLVVGGGILGKGMQSLVESPVVEVVETDILFGPRTMLICDAHEIPFEDGSFDAVVAQAVLEHVVDPYRCTEEIYRVLKKDGLVYAEIPFMQQVHLGRYDFTRFTHLGQRRLFRKFAEIDSGAGGGPGMALAWSYQYFLMSFSDSLFLRKILLVFARLTSFYLKYFDYFLIDKAGALDAASGYYFLGRKSDDQLTDDELIRLYRGANRSEDR